MNLLERLNTSDRFANGIGAQLVEIREGYARAELTVEEKHLNNSITFLKSGQLGENIIAEAVEVLDHHKLPYCEIKVRNEQGELLAVMTGLGYRLKKDFEFDTLM